MDSVECEENDDDLVCPTCSRSASEGMLELASSILKQVLLLSFFILCTCADALSWTPYRRRLQLLSNRDVTNA